MACKRRAGAPASLANAPQISWLICGAWIRVDRAGRPAGAVWGGGSAVGAVCTLVLPRPSARASVRLPTAPFAPCGSIS